MTIPISVVDAFTSVPFKGNPAAVCLLERQADEGWMQRVAAEMNLSETAFLLPEQDGSYSLRWFTPKIEVDICGHATLASAHFLWENGHLDVNGQARFHTRSGVLTAHRSEAGITLDFPAEPVQPATAPEALIQGPGLIPRYVGRNRMDFLVEVDSESTVSSLRPDLSQLVQLPARGIIVTSRTDADCSGGSADPAGHADGCFDFVLRAFFPAAGVDEDPVTGSAHCALAPYWERRLRKRTMRAYQASERGGELLVTIEGERVLLTGEAVTVWSGRLFA